MSENKTHWKKMTNPNYLGAYSFNEGEEKILTIKQVKDELVKGEDGKEEHCIVAYFIEKEKPMILNKTNCKIITKLYKTPYIEEWANRKVQIFVDSVKAFGDVVEALRIKKSIPKVQQKATDLKCTDCKQAIAGYGNTSAAQIASITYNKYGKQLCSDCATKEKARQLENDKGAALSEALDEVANEATNNTKAETENKE